MPDKNILEIYIADDNLDLRPGKIEVLVYDCAAKQYIRFQGIDKVNIFKRLVKPDGIEETEE